MIERRERQLFGKTAYTFNLKAVVENQAENAQRHTQGSIDVRSRDDFHVIHAELGK